VRSPAVRCLSLSCALIICAFAAWSPAANGSAIKPGFDETVVFDGLTEPTDVAFAADGRAFVAEKSGLIKAFANLNATTPTITADLRTQVYNFWDRGLLSIALDPQFPARPYIYALYAYDAAIGGTAPRWGQPGATSDPCPSPPDPTADGCVASSRLTKLTLNAGGTMTSEQVLINDWCQQYPSHSAGDLVFGPDGMLYASGGDGASFTFTDYGQDGNPTNPCGDPPVAVGGKQSPPNAQGGALRSQDLLTPADPTSLDGSLIRIDPDTGAGAPGNPLAGSSDANARRIVATGMRNPFRFTFRPGGSEIYVGDVGWEFWEEINRVPTPVDASVDNFGWPCYEGNGKQAGYQNAGLNLCNQLYDNPGSVSAPLLAYHHTDPIIPGGNCDLGGASISGLAFYGGGEYPDAYDGALFFADYSKRCTWVMFEEDGLPDPQTITGFLRDHDPVNLMIGPGGDLFVVDFEGEIRRVTYDDGNSPPTAVATADPSYGQLPLNVSFDASGSSDPDPGDQLSFAWDLDGDGQYDDSNAVKPTWQYTGAATVTVRLRVTDGGGLTATDTIVIGAGNFPPDARIDSPTAALKWAVGDTISFSGGGTDPDDGALGAASMSWSLILRHCVTVDNCHSHPLQTYPGVAGGSFTAPDHDYPSHLELRLTVTDKGGLSDTETLRLDPRTVDLTFRTEPAGLTLAVGSESAVAPFTRTVIVGSRNSVAAPTPQGLGQTWQGFSSWSDGGARSHEIVAPAAATTYTAAYQQQTPPAGLVAAYGFDETSGATTTDASPSGNTGTVNGATRTASGRYGRALSFDGTNDRVDVPDSASLDLTTAMTLEAWVKPTAISGWRTAILKERGTTGHVYALYASEGNAPIAENFTGSYNGATGAAPLTLNAWTHLASTYDGTTLRLYVDGTQVAQKAVTGAMAATASPLRIGGNALWGEYFAGLIDEVRIYNKALTAAQIQGDMGAPIGAPVPVDSAPPSAPGSLSASGSLGKVTLSWNASTDDVGVNGYEVYRSTTPGFSPALANRIATPATPGYVDTVAAGTYYYRVKAADAAGNLSAASAEASGTATADTTAPSVSVTSPAAGTVSGAVTLKASAADNVGVAGVQFLVDGASFGAEDTSAPYEIEWLSTTVANGTHKISARARDVATNTTTSAEVTVTVSNSAAPAGLVAAFGFEEASGNTTVDASPSANTGTLNGATRSASGRFGRALSFDGTNDRVDVPDSASLDLTTAMTLEAWVRPTSNSGWRTAILKERGSGGHVYALYSSEGSAPIVEVFTSPYNGATGTAALALNTWSHLASTYDGATLRLYVNGTQVASKAMTGAMGATASPLRIGGNALWGEYFAGLIDEVRIYNKALTAAQIQADMNAPVSEPAPTDTTPPSAPGSLSASGSLGKVTLNWNASTDDVAVTGYEVYRSTTPGFTPAAGNRIATPATPGYVDTVAAGTYYYRVKAADAAGNLSAASGEASGSATADTTAPSVSVTSPAAGTVSGAVTLKASASDDVGVAGVQFLVDGAPFGAEDTSAPYEIQWPSDSVANGTHKISARARDGAANTTTSAEVSVTVSNAAPAGLVLAYGFEETTGTSATDASPSKNTGTVNGATRSTAGRYGRALSFDGTNDRVDVPDSTSLDLTTAMTLEAWVKPTSNTGWRTVILKERGTGGHVYALYSSEGTAPIAESFTSAYTGALGTSPLTLNAWSHLATTYDGTALRLYVNGNQVASKAMTGAMAATASPLRIGGNALWGEYFAGLIDEVRIYNKALTTAQIQADMSAPVVP
jgi:glucose/arabinose dehydrogenase/PKD repeat protein